jgi:hypothetical protein
VCEASEQDDDDDGENEKKKTTLLSVSITCNNKKYHVIN